MDIYLFIPSVVFLLTLLFNSKVECYEKTLRKIVRSQSRMVQRPFSETEDRLRILNSGNLHRQIQYPPMVSAESNFAQVKTRYHKRQRNSKISTILSSVETRSKKKFSNNKVNGTFPKDIRATRHIENNAVKAKTNKLAFIDIANSSNSDNPRETIVASIFKIPENSRFFPAVSRDKHSEDKISKKHDVVVISDYKEPEINKSLIVKSLFMTNPMKDKDKTMPNMQMNNLDIAEEKPDYLIEESPLNLKMSYYSYNVSAIPYTCSVIIETKADIDTTQKFAELNIEPPWMTRTHYWNEIFDRRYESLMRNPKWPSLKVILIPRTHVDSIWKKTFDQYYHENVQKILMNMVKKMNFYNNLTFTWNEVSHLSRWWKLTTVKSRSVFRRLLRNEQLEITTGGWVEPDEATTHIYGLVHNLIEGHQWLKIHLDYTPKVAWITNSVTHSPTMIYLLSASGINNLVMTNVHYAWEQYFAEYQYSDFVWLQNWELNKYPQSKVNDALNRIGNDRYPKHAMLTHFMQFNTAGFKACGPNKVICYTDFNFAISNKNFDINSLNVKEKAEALLEQYSKTGTLSPHNVIIAPIGGPYHYETPAEYDYQFNNYQKLAEFVNVNREIYKATIEFGTPKDYFENISYKHKSYPSLRGDFMNFADVDSGLPAYWTGFFTTRPMFKILLRRLQSTLRSTELLFSFTVSHNAIEDESILEVIQVLKRARESVLLLLDRNVVSGTLTINVLKYAYSILIKTVKDLWHIQEITASILTKKRDNDTNYLQKYVYRDGEFISVFKTVGAGDQVYIFNSLSHERQEFVELMTREPNVRIVDHRNRDVQVQINPVWRYNRNKIRISMRYYRVTFIVTIPPMTLELFYIKDTYSSQYNFASAYCSNCDLDNYLNQSYPINVHAIESGDIQLESYKYRFTFDENTGFLKAVVDKETSVEKTVIIDFSAFRSSNINAGMFVFSTNTSKPLEDVLGRFKFGVNRRGIIIISGSLTTEITSVYGKLLQHTVKVVNVREGVLANAIYLETKVDYEMSPKNRELELYMSIQTDIGNGNAPIIYTDNNGFQYTPRIINITRRIESNVFPITSMAFIQDNRNRMSFITDHAQAVTSMQEGQLVVILDRRVLFNDGKGSGEGLADSSLTCHRNILLLENLKEPANKQYLPKEDVLQLPSLNAVFLSNSLNYYLDMFFIDRKRKDSSYYNYIPFVKMMLPCDVSILSYRVLFSSGGGKYVSPNSALLTLHRQSVSCLIGSQADFQCSSESSFYIDKVLRNFKAAYQTNLVGTDRGIPNRLFNLGNFPPMEIITIRVHF